MQEHQKPWNPLSIHEVALVFTDAHFPWWIAGGYALELALGRTIRPHADIDVLVLRRDLNDIQELLNRWDCWVADPPGQLRKWGDNEMLPLGVHDIWCRRTPTDAWRMQLMVDETDGDEWVSRRDSRIHASIDAITRVTPDGLRYLAPHIQLYYKAKNPRAKDEFDFNVAVEQNVDMDKIWLRQSIAQCHGDDHAWIKRLLR